jgi:hypothetical protein
MWNLAGETVDPKEKKSAFFFFICLKWNNEIILDFKDSTLVFIF